MSTFNYHSKRAAQARLSVKIKPIHNLFLVASLILVATGIALILLKIAAGWLVLSLFAWPLMIYEWYKHHLHHLPSDTKSGTIDGIISGDILGILPEQPTPYDAAEAAGKVYGGLFMGARFGITPTMLTNLASKDPNDMPKFWEVAEQVRVAAGVERISGSVFAVAIVKMFPDYQNILAQIHLDDGDLESGVRWQEHIRQLIKRKSEPKKTGGIARDWSFGYIPMLRRYALDVSQEVSGGTLTVPIDSHQELVDQIIETFGGGGRQNVALIGPAGVGKTTLVKSFAEVLLDAKSKIPENLRFRQVFMLDSASLLAAAPGRGQLENLVMSILGEAYDAKNIIVCLDNAQLFFEEGVGSVDLTNVLQPVLEAGNLRMILAMDEQRFLQISQRNSSFANSLNRINVSGASKEDTISVMQDQLLITEGQRNVIYTYQSLEEAYRLSERYIYDLEMPGRALKLMETAAGFSENGVVTINSVQTAIEKTLDVKVSVASDTSDREKLLNLEDLIHQRMINQVRAVQVVSDALRRARAGVRNQNRPIGTFLFLGPTGVGKTELAKALADVYFNGEDRMIRLDLNEYVRQEDVARLIADGADDPTSLTAQVMKQPFSVVLLDEIEKAHPNVLTTLLQLLDEGILRDIKNREVSFRDAIVIATSNAGAERIREYIERGWQLEQFEQQIQDELINSNQFRPEFLNRFDEIVVFKPLEKPELIQVIDLIIKGVNKTLAPQKISVEVSNDAKAYLVDRGYDPRLGARPMRRVVQKAVENTVARHVLAGTATNGSIINIDLDQVQQILGSEQSAAAISENNYSQPANPSV